MNQVLNQNCSRNTLFLPWLIWFIAALFYLYEYFLQVSPNVMLPELMSAFKIDGTQLGNLVGIYFIAYAGMQIPVSLLLDSIGPKKALTLATFVCMLGCLLFGITHSFTQAMLARFLLGLGSAFAAVSCLKIVATWFPLNRFAVLSGLTVTMGTLGGIIGQGPLALLVDNISWRSAMVILAAISGLLMLLIIFIMRDHPSEKINVINKSEQQDKKRNIFSGLVNITKNRQCWLIACYGGLMYMPTTILGTLWGASFISLAYNINRPLAANYIAALFFGWIIGSPSFGLLSDKIRRRKLPMYIGSIGSLLCLISIIYLHPPIILLGVLFFSFGFFSSGFLPSFSIILEINHPKENATALGFMNTLNMVGPILLQPLVGYILDIHSSGINQNGVRLYDIAAYKMAFLLLPTCMFISILLLPFIRETFCQRKVTMPNN